MLEVFRIPTDNMSPALEAGDYIFVNKLAYGFRYPTSGYASTKLSLPKRGDIAVFVLNADGQKEYIKRVVAIEGDKVEIKAGILIVNGQNISVPQELYYRETFENHSYLVKWNSADKDIHMPEVVVPKDHFFVLSDDRSHTIDSRKWGYLPRSSLVGRAWRIWFSSSEKPGEQGGIRWSRMGQRVL